MTKEQFRFGMDELFVPSQELVVERFERAFARTNDVHSAMSAVNELMVRPVSYETYLDRWRREHE